MTTKMKSHWNLLDLDTGTGTSLYNTPSMAEALDIWELQHMTARRKKTEDEVYILSDDSGTDPRSFRLARIRTTR